MNRRRVEIKLNDSEDAKLLEKIRESGLNQNAVIRKLITGVKVHEKPPEDYYDLLYSINTLATDIEMLVKRIDNGTASVNHLKYIIEKIDQLYDKMAEKYLY